MTEAATSALRDDRRTFLRCRRRTLAASGATVIALGVLAALFLAPNRLASLRLGDVALAWWMAGAVTLTGLVALARGFRDAGPLVRSAGTSGFAPLALAAVWSSPAVWLGLPPVLLADGAWGLWPPTVVVGGALVALLLHGAPWSRTGGLMVTASALTRARWPGARGCQVLLASIEGAVLLVFAWAQLAAARELGGLLDWPRAVPIGVTLLVLGVLLLPPVLRLRLTAVGGGLALAGLALPLGAITLATTPLWPAVWNAVATRPRIAFGEGSAWTGEGGPVRGPAVAPTLRFGDAQRVEFSSPGSVVIEPREGGRLTRDVEAGEQVALHPGDQIVVRAGFPLRFEAGRRIPDAPDSGPEWVEPRSRPAGWPWLMALGVTGFVGALGLPIGRIPVGAGRLSPRRSAGLAAGLVTAGVALPVGWSLYALWLTPEVYLGGVSGVEIYTLAASLRESPASGHSLTWLALGGLAVGGAAAVLGCARDLPNAWRDLAGVWARRLGLALVAGAGLLACLAPVDAWTLLLLALGLAASVLAPAAALACWSERATPESVAGGAAAGLAVFLLVTVLGVTNPEDMAAWWGSAVAAAPAVLAVPVHLLAAWILRAREVPSVRNPLPPGLEQLSLPFPPPRAG